MNKLQELKDFIVEEAYLDNQYIAFDYYIHTKTSKDIFYKHTSFAS